MDFEYEKVGVGQLKKKRKEKISFNDINMYEININCSLLIFFVGYFEIIS